MEKFPPPIKVKIFYDKTLQKITGKNFEEAVVSENLLFVELLNFVFSSYPKIPQIFPPGTLGFLLNNRPPKEDDILKNNDEVKFISGANSVQYKD